MSANLTIPSNVRVLAGPIVLGGGGNYTLPIANATVLGGVKQGANVSISATGVLSVNLPTGGGGNYTLPVASATVLGGVKQGANVAISATGVLSVDLPPAANLSGYMLTPNGTTEGQIITFDGHSWGAFDPAAFYVRRDRLEYVSKFGVGFKTGDNGLFATGITYDANPYLPEQYLTKQMCDRDYSVIGHTHPISDIIGLDTELANLTTGLAGKANLTHNHTQAEIDGLESNLTTIKASLADLGNKTAPANATTAGLVLPTGNITVTGTGGIDVNLGGYIPKPATATANQVLTYNGTAWGAADATSGGGTVDLSGYIPRSNVTSAFYGAPAVAMSNGTNVVGVYSDGTAGVFNGLNEIALTPAGPSHMIAESADGAMKSKLQVTISAITLESKDLTKSGAIGVNSQGVTAFQPAGIVVVGDTVITGGLGDARYIQKPATATANQVLTYNGTNWLSANAAVNYSLPIASATTLGGVKAGGNVTIDGTGLLSVNMPTAYTLPIANATSLGGIKQGANTTIAANGAISVILPAAANLTGYLTQNTANTLYQPIGGGLQTLADAASIAWTLDPSKIATVTLGGSRTLANPTNKAAGGTYLLIVKQDATGSRTLAYGTEYKFPSGIKPIMPTAPNSVTILTFVTDGVNMYGLSQGDFK